MSRLAAEHLAASDIGSCRYDTDSEEDQRLSTHNQKKKQKSRPATQIDILGRSIETGALGTALRGRTLIQTEHFKSI